MERVWLFDFDTLTWSPRKCSNGRTDWIFGHAINRGPCMYALGMHGKEDQPGPCQVSFAPVPAFEIWWEPESSGMPQTAAPMLWLWAYTAEMSSMASPATARKALHVVPRRLDDLW